MKENSIKPTLIVFFSAIVTVLGLTILPKMKCTLNKSGQYQSDYPITPVPFTDIILTDSFWSKRIETHLDIMFDHR